MEKEEREWRIRPYYKSGLGQAYAPDICPGAALNRLAMWIRTNTQLSEALKQTEAKDFYRFEQRNPDTGERSYCGVPIPADAPPRPNDQAVWCEGKWVF